MVDIIDLYWSFQVCRDEVHKDQVLPDLPYLNATTWASHESLRLRNPTAHNSPGIL